MTAEPQPISMVAPRRIALWTAEETVSGKEAGSKNTDLTPLKVDTLVVSRYIVAKWSQFFPMYPFLAGNSREENRQQNLDYG